MGSICHKCSAICCRYVALPFDEPTTEAAFQEARWFLLHKGVTIFVTDGQWYISMATPCEHLSEAGLCGIYETRPTICREYSDRRCDYHGGDYEYSMFFTHPDQIARYAEKALAKRKGGKGRGG